MRTHAHACRRCPAWPDTRRITFKHVNRPSVARAQAKRDRGTQCNRPRRETESEREREANR
eukprot:55125-Alexandrium_andersonii.AAC.1